MRCRAAVMFVTVGVLCSGVSAQVVEDWSSGTDINWFRVDFLRNPPGPFDLGGTSFTVADGGYTMASNAVLPPLPAALGASSVFLPSLFSPAFSEGAIRTVVRFNNETTDAFLLARGTLETGDYYNLVFGASSEGTVLVINRFAAFINGTGLASVDLGVLTPGTDYNVEFAFFGSQLSGKVWAVGEPEPATPQVTAVDATYAVGGFGLGVAMVPNTEGRISVTYGSVSFIPTPSGAGVLAVIGGVVALRRRR